jgi:hypothetical protein
MLRRREPVLLAVAHPTSRKGREKWGTLCVVISAKSPEHSSAARGVGGDEGAENFEVRGSHSSKTATSGAASVVEAEAHLGLPIFSESFAHRRA